MLLRRRSVEGKKNGGGIEKLDDGDGGKRRGCIQRAA